MSPVDLDRLMGRRPRTEKFYLVTDQRQLLGLEAYTVIRVDRQRTTAGIYGSCFRIMRLLEEGHRVEIAQ